MHVYVCHLNFATCRLQDQSTLWWYHGHSNHVSFLILQNASLKLIISNSVLHYGDSFPVIASPNYMAPNYMAQHQVQLNSTSEQGLSLPVSIYVISVWLKHQWWYETALQQQQLILQFQRTVESRKYVHLSGCSKWGVDIFSKPPSDPIPSLGLGSRCMVTSLVTTVSTQVALNVDWTAQRRRGQWR